MPNEEIKKYTDALNNFSESIAALSESIINTVKNDDKSKETFQHIIGSNSPIFGKINEIAEGIKQISEEQTEAKDNTAAILKEVQSLKEEKERGFFSNLTKKGKAGKENKKGLFEGIKAIVLMAGGILAIGGAFKLIGQVDFASVLALSVALPLVAEGFNKIGSMNMDAGGYANAAIGMIIMASALIPVSWAFKQVEPIGFPQFIGISIVALTAAASMVIMGGTLWLIEKMKLDNNSWVDLPFISGLSAAAIWASSEILNKTTIGFNWLEIMKASLAIGAMSVIMGGTIYALDKMKLSIKSIFLGGIAILGSAAVVAGASQLLALGKYDEYPSLDWVSNVGVLLLGFGTAMGIMGIPAVAMSILIGTIPMLAIAGTILAVDLIISKGKYDSIIPLDWAINVGTALGLVGTSAAMIGFSFPFVIAGLIGIIGIAGSILAVDLLISKGKYDSIIPLDWALGTGAALAGFGAEAMMIGFAFPFVIAGLVGLLGIAATISEVSMIVQKGKYIGGPSVEWSLGVGSALNSFAQAVTAFKPSLLQGVMSFFGKGSSDNVEMMKRIAQLMPEIDEIIAKHTFSTGMNADWGIGVGNAISGFAIAISNLKDAKLDPNNITLWKPSIITLSEIMSDIDGILSGGNFAIYPSTEWSEGITFSLETFIDTMIWMDKRGRTSDLTQKISNVLLLTATMSGMANLLKNSSFNNYPEYSWTNGINHFINKLLGNEFIGGDIGNNLVKIRLLSSGLLVLADSINTLANSMQSFDSSPALKDVYEGLLVLSIIDYNALNNVLSTVQNKGGESTKLMSTGMGSINKTTDGTKGAMETIFSTIGNSFKNIFSGSSGESTDISQEMESSDSGRGGISKSREPIVVNPVEKSNVLLEEINKTLLEIKKINESISGGTNKRKSRIT